MGLLQDRALNIFIATVWLVNGLFCKVLDLVPRHEAIVASILSQEHSRLLTTGIGVLEILMAVWVLSGIKPKQCAFVQIAAIVVMNTLEFVLVPELLLWGRFNALFALLFIGLIYYHAFVLGSGLKQRKIRP